jgi:hypothetical protein
MLIWVETEGNWMPAKWQDIVSAPMGLSSDHPYAMVPIKRKLEKLQISHDGNT